LHTHTHGEKCGKMQGNHVEGCIDATKGQLALPHFPYPLELYEKQKNIYIKEKLP